jgi:hypothetical protein
MSGIPWRQVRQMPKASQENVQAILTALSDACPELPKLVLGKSPIGYVAKMVHEMGMPHSDVSIVNKLHFPVSVMYKGEVFGSVEDVCKLTGDASAHTPDGVWAQTNLWRNETWQAN